MPDREQREESLSALVVKEAVERGMETGFRDQIVEAVDEADGGGSTSAAKVSLASGLVGLGVAIGYLLGRGDLSSEELPLDEVETPDAVEEVTTGELTDASDADETDEDAESGGSRTIPMLILLVGAAVGLEFLRRRMGGDEEWEPIEEFEPATEATFSDEDETDADEEMDDDEETAASTDEDEEE